MKRITQKRLSVVCFLLALLLFFTALGGALCQKVTLTLPARALLALAFPLKPEPSPPSVRLLSAAFPSLSSGTPSPSPSPTAPPGDMSPLPSETPVHEFTQTRTEGDAGTEGIYLNNNTQKAVDVAALLSLPSSVHITPDAPCVLIIHTHTSEAYTPTSEMPYTPTDTDRTEDPAFNVVRVGEELKRVLEEAGIPTVHDSTVNDYPSYNGSYQKAYHRLAELLAAYPSVSVVIDLHRDALLYEDGSKMKVVWDSPGGKAAQCMLVLGTNERLEHPHWQQNLSLALKLQSEMNRTYPNLARPVNLAKHRYNQQVSKGAFILEMGASGNTLEEALLGVRYVGECLARVLLSESEKNT